MYSTADYSVTPRPMYPADGRKIPDVYTAPSSLRDELQSTLGDVSAVRVLGPARVDPIDAMDRRCGDARRSDRFNPTLTLSTCRISITTCSASAPAPAAAADLRAGRRGRAAT